LQGSASIHVSDEAERAKSERSRTRSQPL
jgi:hypothetical protein